MIENQPNLILAKKLNRLAIIITCLVLPLVFIMGIPKFKIQTGIDFSFLPIIYSFINIGVAASLIYALIAIKRKDIAKHKKAMMTAMVLSAIFLVLYVVYHFTSEPIRYCKTGGIRTLYFILLNSHIVLSGLSFPFIFFTFIRGYTGQVEKHRKMAKWVFPIWLYIAITGPILYLMLIPCIQ